MIRVARPDEPAGFDVACRQAGKQWLTANLEKDPHSNPLWSGFKEPLRLAFGGRCAFLAMYIPRGTVDHWISIKSDRTLTYEWTNYRFVDGAVNSAKKPAWEGKLLDPFEVEDDWFEILLPSLQLGVAATSLDPAVFARAKFTLEKLGLDDGEDVIRLRSEWLALYDSGDLTLAGLFKLAPLLARAVAKRDGLRLPEPSTSGAAQPPP